MAADLSSPAMPPPKGVTPNFTTPGTLFTINAIAQSVCVTLSGATLLLRCYGRLFVRTRKWGLEDWLLCLAFLGIVAESVVHTMIIHNGGGAHQWNLTIGKLQKMLFLFWLGSMLYSPIILFAKVAILCMYLRIFCPRPYKFTWWTIHTLIISCSTFYLASMFVKIWQCTPRERIWNKNVNGSCVNAGTVLMASGLFNTISDILILLVPVKGVWKLKMSLRRKMGACLILTFGAVAPVFSAVGFYVRLRTVSNLDQSFNLPKIQYFGQAELAIAITCACLPAVPAIYRANFASEGSKQGSSERLSSGKGHIPALTQSNKRGDKMGVRRHMHDEEEHYHLENGHISDDSKSEFRPSGDLHLEGGDNKAALISDVKVSVPDDSEERLVWANASRTGSNFDGIVRTVCFDKSDNLEIRAS